MLAWLRAFTDLSEELGHLPALGGSAARLRERLERIWPQATHTLPYYPAFQRV